MLFFYFGLLITPWGCMQGDYGMIKTIKHYNLYDLAKEISFLNRLLAVNLQTDKFVTT